VHLQPLDVYARNNSQENQVDELEDDEIDENGEVDELEDDQNEIDELEHDQNESDKLEDDQKESGAGNEGRKNKRRSKIARRKVAAERGRKLEKRARRGEVRSCGRADLDSSLHLTQIALKRAKVTQKPFHMASARGREWNQRQFWSCLGMEPLNNLDIGPVLHLNTKCLQPIQAYIKSHPGMDSSSFFSDYAHVETVCSLFGDDQTLHVRVG
jgi:hypothetical protein